MVRSNKISISQGLLATALIASFALHAVCGKCECFPSQEPRRCCEYDCEDEETCDTISQLLACIFAQNVESTECKQVLDCRQTCSGRSGSSQMACSSADRDPQSCYTCAQDNEAEQNACNTCILTAEDISPACRDILQGGYGCRRAEEDICDSEEEDESSGPTFTGSQNQEGSLSPPSPTPPNPPPQTSTLVPAIVCATAVILVTAIVVILALYWKFRIKLLKLKEERHSAQSMMYDSTASNRARTDPVWARTDPVYSVIGQQTSPPALPPDRVPYYQEIQSDILPANYEESVSSVKSMKMAAGPGKTGEAKAASDEAEPYQEPADALKRF